MVTFRAKVPPTWADGWAGAGGCIRVAVAADGFTICGSWSNGISLCIPVAVFLWAMANGCPLFGGAKAQCGIWCPPQLMHLSWKGLTNESR